ncbi:MAG: AzlC family ABC transporter permease [Ruminococcaceae bacterium]|nr:AzlC family ABC transporter permease [Oscillospiraceae bacterium]
MANRKTWFLRGVRDGVPIGLGYFAVSFALGIKAVGAGISPLEAALMSLLNLTSAGEAAAIVLLGVGTTYVELAFTQLVINLRYLLMSCALSQRIAPESSVLHRLLVGYGVTDEIFGISMGVQDKFSPYYSYGAIAVAAPCWALGTLLGALLGNILPANLVSALGVALYAMFLAVILPPARKSRVIAGIILVSMLASTLLTLACTHFGWTFLTEGFRIILLTVVISAAAAVLFPVREETEVSDEN